ncbi:Glucose transporter 4 enhancer factor [Carabus blaptoides fortunei]
MSTGKRLAKRSIIGTRVCAPGDDGKYYSGIIQAVKTPAPFADNSNCINLTPNTRYTVKFDYKDAAPLRGYREYRECELIGPGFRTISGVRLLAGQKVYLTYNGREVSGKVVAHATNSDELNITAYPPGHEGPVELVKRLEEVRLLESRKSARLMDQDTDFARLADMVGGERKRQASHTIDVPATSTTHGSRKRRPSNSHDDGSRDALMDECNAALVLMSLSCSPHSPNIGSMWGGTSPGGVSSSSSTSWRSGSPSPSPPLSETDAVTSGGGTWGARTTPPPLLSAPGSDEGIGLDYDELPRKKKASRIVFQCTWPGCLVITTTCTAIEAHVRTTHLSDIKPLQEHEEEFYYTEVEMGQHTSSPPTMSHRDMARPPHEDPEYQRQIVGSFRQGLLAGQAGPINIPPVQHQYQYHQPSSPQKLLKLSPRPASSYPYPSPSSSSPPALLALSAGKTPASPSRRIRGENKKCRKVYGMEHREQWCTQCKWKKACSRFGD